MHAFVPPCGAVRLAPVAVARNHDNERVLISVPRVARAVWHFTRNLWPRKPSVDEQPDNDGLEERLLAREQRERERVQSPPPPPEPMAQCEEKQNARNGFFFFGRRRQKENVEKEVNDSDPALFAGLYESRVYDYLAEALDRREQSAATDSELQTVLPYDLQRALFDEMRSKSAGSATPQSPSAKARRRRRARTVMTKTPTVPNEPIPQRVLGAVLSIFRRRNARDRKDGAAAYAEALARDPDVELAEGGAAAAYATAAAIATSATLRGRVDSTEARRLSASVAAARAVDNAQDALVFVETVGVLPLVRAACALHGSARSNALTALANLAIMLPASRMDMLNADDGALLPELADTIQAAPRAFEPASGVADAAQARTEALVSAAHLLGSLALATGAVGREWRLRFAANDELVRNLTRLSGGLKHGEPEGAARAARRALAALGINKWRPRVPGQRGLRILSIDGGGTRAIMAFEMLKHLKQLTGCEVHELFDVIGGTSTGAIVAASLGMAHKSVEEVEALYRDLIGKIFAKHPVNGPKMLLTRAYYDTSVLERTLKRECGSGVFIDSQAEDGMNKVFVVSSVMSRDPQELHVFRNYTYPAGHESRYDGSVDAQLWEALRASSAAPTFFSEIRVNGELHADGAIVANNPTAVALHESKCMYPGVPIELVVSLGNGQSPADAASPAERAAAAVDKPKNVGWGEVFGSIVASATSTETVHHALQDLFPPEKYFRFNPTTDSTQIDETRPDQLALFVKDSKAYITANAQQFETVAAVLRPKTPRSLWRRLCQAIQNELQVLRATTEDDIYLPQTNHMP